LSLAFASTGSTPLSHIGRFPAGRGDLKEGGTDTINIQLALTKEWLNRKPEGARRKILGLNSLQVYHPRSKEACRRAATLFERTHGRR
jgi:hypothetical protein